MRLDRIIKGGNVVTPSGTFTGDVGIAGEKIAALGADLEPAPGTEVIDATGHHVLPGVLDVHVHLALPFCGTVSADDYRTGTRAGARGGVTTVIDFAIPYAGESLDQAADNWMQKAEGKALIDYTFHICITRWIASASMKLGRVIGWSRAPYFAISSGVWFRAINSSSTRADSACTSSIVPCSRICSSVPKRARSSDCHPSDS